MHKWAPLVAICLGTFMLLVDVTIVTVSLPQMATGLHARISELQWVLDGYALTLAALLLGAGSFADRFGHRRVYLASLVVFAIASLACGLAPDAGTLIAARFVQGVGGAAMYATTMALLNTTYHGRDRGVAFGVWGAVSGAAAAIGPILGGLLTEWLGWRAIFWVNLPVSVVALVLTARVVAPSAVSGRARLDLPGMASFTATAGALTYALIRAGGHGWTDPVTCALFATGALALAMFVAVEMRREQPMLDLRLLRDRRFAGVLFAALMVNATAFAVLPFSSLWVQSVRGLGPISAGLVLTPMAVASFVVSAMAGRFLHGRAVYPAIVAGMALIAIGDLAQAVVGAGSSATVLIGGLVVAGAGCGLALPTLSSAAMAAVPPERGGMAGGAVNTFRQLGYAMGVAVLGTVFAARITAVARQHDPRGGAALGHAISGGGAGAVRAHTPAEARATVGHLIDTASAAGLRAGYLVAAGLGLLAVVGLLLAAAAAHRTARRSQNPATRPGNTHREVVG